MKTKAELVEAARSIMIKPEVEAEIRRLAAKNGERITTDEIVEVARSESSVLHAEFDWLAMMTQHMLAAYNRHES
jgi:hypothetical protein